MTKAKATALLEAFLAAKAAGQEELWRAVHPEAPDGPTVLILLLLADRKLVTKRALEQALETVDNRCALRMATYAAIAAHPVWVNYRGALDEKCRAAPGEAIRAAIACYQDPTEENRRAANGAWRDAYSVSALAAEDAGYEAATARAAYATARAAYAAAFVACAAACAASAAAEAAYAATSAVLEAGYAVGNINVVVNSIIAAIADHYEGRPLEMP